MAVDFCTESFNWTMSPRISFSHNLILSDGNGSSDCIPVDSHRPGPDPSPDFDFCVFRRSDHEPSAADELFSDGKILPSQFKGPPVVAVLAGSSADQPPPPEPASCPCPAQQGREEENLAEIEEEKPARSRLFCFFRRSSSLNSGNGHRSSSICSLQLLSRSHSTGSTCQNPKNLHSRETQKAFVQRPLFNSDSNAFPPSLSSSSSLPKPSSKKNGSAGKTHFGSHGNGVRINPVLNVPSPYISEGTCLFGFGYFFCNNSKGRKSKKKPFPPNAP